MKQGHFFSERFFTVTRDSTVLENNSVHCVKPNKLHNIFTWKISAKEQAS